MFRNLIPDFKEYPATMSLCALWVITFAMMILTQIGQGSSPSLSDLVMSLHDGHPFGDMTLDELWHGEIWRALTSTFVHYGLLHIGMNLYGMYLLGCMVESWYGPAQFLAVYVLIGGGGNLLSGLLRRWVGSNPEVHSGGGSTVVLGLVALCAVVGWRSRTRIGAYLSRQMIGVLIFTALLGQMIPIIDNWGHAGGALVGGAIGFAHRTLIRTAHRPIARWAGVFGAVLVIASGSAQILDDRAEATQARAARVRVIQSAERQVEDSTRSVDDLVAIERFYRLAADRSAFSYAPALPRSLLHLEEPPQAERPEGLSLFDSSDEQFRAALDRNLTRLDRLKGRLGVGPRAGAFGRMRVLLARVLDAPPTVRDRVEFSARGKALVSWASQDRELARATLRALDRERRP